MRLFFYFLVLFFSFSSFGSASQHEREHILVIHSYSLNESWVRGINTGIKDKLENDALIDIEYLNSKNVSVVDLPKYKMATLEYLKLKLSREKQYNGIILVDDFSLDVFLELNNKYFKEIPVVAIGIGKPHPSLPSNIKVFNEHIDIEKNVAFIKQILPNTNEINVIYDHSIVGEHLYDTYNKISNYSDVKLNHKQPDHILDLISSVKTAPKIPTLLVVYYKDWNDNLWEPASIAEILSIKNVKVFSTYRFYIQKNILGGFAVSHRALGELASNYISDILENKKHKEDDFETSFYFANVQAFKTAGLKLALPKNTILLNNKESAYYFYFTLLLIVIVILFYFFTEKKSNKKLSEREKIIYLLSDVIECRSGETGQHVKNVSHVSRLLAKLSGMNNNDCDLIAKYSPLHDVGKIGVSDSILNKPGKLTDEEFSEMKLHTKYGYNLLKNSGIDDFKIGALIAYQHHERWDGKGYPNALKGDHISIYARIVSIADVFDALTTQRIYKDAWTFEATKKYFEEESGKQFDPTLIQIFLQNYDSFVNLKTMED